MTVAPDDLKHTLKLSDEDVVAGRVEDPYWQYLILKQWKKGHLIEANNAYNAYKDVL